MPEPIGSAPNDAAKRPGSIGLKPSDACCQTLEARPIQALRGCAGETVPPELPPVTGAALRRGETERFSIFRWNKILEGKQMAIVGRNHQLAFLARERSDRGHIGIDQRSEEL